MFLIQTSALSVNNYEQTTFRNVWHYKFKNHKNAFWTKPRASRDKNLKNQSNKIARNDTTKLLQHPYILWHFAIHALGFASYLCAQEDCLAHERLWSEQCWCVGMWFMLWMAASSLLLSMANIVLLVCRSCGMHEQCYRSVLHVGVRVMLYCCWAWQDRGFLVCRSGSLDYFSLWEGEVWGRD